VSIFIEAVANSVANVAFDYAIQLAGGKGIAGRTRILVYFGAALVGIVLATSGVAIWSWTWSTALDQQLIAATLVITCGIFALAAVGGAVAVSAYIATIQVPELTAQLSTPYFPDFMIDTTRPQANGWYPLADFARLTGTIAW
jgi:hypothetical protein